MHFTLCADDFGLHQGTDDGIVELIRAGRLNAVSCMSLGDTLDKNATNLLQAAEAAEHQVQIGLHLTFTEYSPLGSMPHLAPDGVLPTVGTLIKRSHLRQLNRAEIIEQIKRQVQVFSDTFGRSPDFLDGHQHAHILPGIRDAVIATVKDMPRGVWVRSCDLPLGAIARLGVGVRRAAVISILSRGLKRRLLRQGVPTNDVFYGVNDFVPDQEFGNLMKSWLSAAGNRRKPALIMCHPGLANVSGTWDPIAARRPDELSYLASVQFLRDMQDNALTLASPRS
jgi:hypothetical protein